MAPPPPSQAGKFKPRKPAKKIRVGETASAAGVSASDSQQASTSTSGKSSSSSGRGGGGRGGRGGRGSGRGGRGALAQGQVFFTATPKPDAIASSASARRGAGSGSKTSKTTSSPSSAAAATTNAAQHGRCRDVARARAGEKKDSSQEEIVGLLDEVVGGNMPSVSEVHSSDAKTRSEDLFDDRENGVSALGARGSSRRSGAQVDGYFYDDDSSDEECDIGPAGGTHAEGSVQPLELPFPSSTRTRTSTVGSSSPVGALNPQSPAPCFSIFTELQSQENDGDDDTHWLLLQLPTRLPPLQQENPPAQPVPVVKTEESLSSSSPLSPQHVQVNVSPLQTDRFDNALAESVPGKLGKIVVYKSGKTFLILEGSDGSSNPIRMNVTEQSCAFRQQAVAIDVDKGELAILGDVQHTIVATPDLR